MKKKNRRNAANLEAQLRDDAASLLKQGAQPLVLGVCRQLEVLLVVVLLQGSNPSILLPSHLVPLPAPHMTPASGVYSKH